MNDSINQMCALENLYGEHSTTVSALCRRWRIGGSERKYFLHGAYMFMSDDMTLGEVGKELHFLIDIANAHVI